MEKRRRRPEESQRERGRHWKRTAERSILDVSRRSLLLIARTLSFAYISHTVTHHRQSPLPLLLLSPSSYSLHSFPFRCAIYVLYRPLYIYISKNLLYTSIALPVPHLYWFRLKILLRTLFVSPEPWYTIMHFCHCLIYAIRHPAAPVSPPLGLLYNVRLL